MADAAVGAPVKPGHDGKGKKAKKGVDPFRRALYAKIELAKKQLGLDDDTYRDLLEARYGKRSRKQLRTPELVELVEHFRGLGFKAAPPRSGRGAGAGRRPAADSREQRKIRALWLTLWNLGAIEDASEAALAGFARRVTGGRETGVAALRWIRGEDAFKVIEALKARAARAGVDWSSYRVWRDRVEVSEEHPRARVIEAQWRILCELKIMHNPHGLDSWISLMAGQKRAITALNLEAAEADRIIAAFGVKIRRARGIGEAAS